MDCAREERPQAFLARRVGTCGSYTQCPSQTEVERGTEAYAKRRQAATARRDREQTAYIEEFTEAVFQFLAFDARHEPLARQMAKVIAEHATPIGSGTVARTERIPIEQRAESAVIAWMRHQQLAMTT